MMRANCPKGDIALSYYPLVALIRVALREVHLHDLMGVEWLKVLHEVPNEPAGGIDEVLVEEIDAEGL
jgi:hypothetical protein